MGQGFQVNVRNVCGEAIVVSGSPAQSIGAGAIPETTLQNGQDLAQVLPQRAPQYFELSSDSIGVVILQVAPAANPDSTTRWQLLFDPTTVVGPGFPFMTTLPLLSPVILSNQTYGYPSVVVGVWSKWTMAVVTVFAGSKSNLALPGG